MVHPRVCRSADAESWHRDFRTAGRSSCGWDRPRGSRAGPSWGPRGIWVRDHIKWLPPRLGEKTGVRRSSLLWRLDNAIGISTTRLGFLDEAMRSRDDLEAGGVLFTHTYALTPRHPPLNRHSIQPEPPPASSVPAFRVGEGTTRQDTATPLSTPHTLMCPVSGIESDEGASSSGSLRVMDLPGKAHREPAVESRFPPSITGLGTMGATINRSGTGAVCMFQTRNGWSAASGAPAIPSRLPRTAEDDPPHLPPGERPAGGPSPAVSRATWAAGSGGAAVFRARPWGWAWGGRLLARSHGTACLCVAARLIGAEEGRFHDDIVGTARVGEIFLEVCFRDGGRSPRGLGWSISGQRSWGRGASPRWLVASVTLI